MAATTAPKPTRLATLKMGSTAALAPASMLARRDGMRFPLQASRVTIAAASAVATAQTPRHGGQGRAAPARLGQEGGIDPWRRHEGYGEVDDDHHDERQRRGQDARVTGACSLR